MDDVKIIRDQYSLNDKIDQKELNKLLKAIAPEIDLSMLDLENLTIEFDVETPPFEIPNYIKEFKSERTRLKRIFNKDRLDFINTVIWGLLRTNDMSRIVLSLYDELVEIIEENEISDLDNSALLDTKIIKETRYKNFQNFYEKNLKIYGIDFIDYYNYKSRKFKLKRKDNCIGYYNIQYKLPLLNKFFNKSHYFEINPDSHMDAIVAEVTKFQKKYSSNFIIKLPKGNLFEILTSSLILYKYKTHTDSYSKAIRYFNYHLLQVYGVKNKYSESLLLIETKKKFEITFHSKQSRTEFLKHFEKTISPVK